MKDVPSQGDGAVGQLVEFPVTNTLVFKDGFTAETFRGEDLMLWMVALG